MNSTIILDQCRNSEKMSFPEAGNAVDPITGERKNGGADWSRTSDPHNAIVVLYQLSYDPTKGTAIVWIGF